MAKEYQIIHLHILINFNFNVSHLKNGSVIIDYVKLHNRLYDEFFNAFANSSFLKELIEQIISCDQSILNKLEEEFQFLDLNIEILLLKIRTTKDKQEVNSAFNFLEYVKIYSSILDFLSVYLKLVIGQDKNQCILNWSQIQKLLSMHKLLVENREKLLNYF